jgi:rubrerythrin
MAAESSWNLTSFQVHDIYRMAVAIEQGGQEFYLRVIDSTDSQRIKNELRFLGDEEARHKAFFEKQLLDRGVAVDEPLSPKLGKLLEEQFLEPAEALYRSKKIASNAEALRFGMEIEQKTIDFYTALLEKQQEAEVRKDLETIIGEERKHKQKLNIILAY